MKKYTDQRPRRHPIRVPARQKGFTLLLAMIMILVMTVFGIFALNNSILQARMSANYRDSRVAFEGAELALRWGETFLQSRTPIERPFPCQTLNPADPQALSNCANPRQVVASGLMVNNVTVDKDDVEEGDPWGCAADPTRPATTYWAYNARYFGEDPEVASTCGSPSMINSDTAWDLTNTARGDRALSQQPRFMMEEAFVDRDDLAGNPQQGRVFYRVYAASTGERNTTVSVLESSVAKRFQ